MNINPDNDNLYSRRKFLELSGLALGSVVGGSLIGACSSTSSPNSIVRPPKGLSQIDHVIIVMQENRSFDHYFGTLNGVNGYQNAINTNESILYQNFSANTASSPVGKLLPFHLDTLTSPVACILDLDHSWAPQHKYWNNGKMDGFGSEHLLVDGSAAGRNTMAYYMRQDLPFHYFLADTFTLCDAYHCSVIGPTHPNRVMSIAGTIDPEGKFGGPILRTRESVKYEGSVDFTTMPERLLANGISWKFYEMRNALLTPGTSLSAIASDNPLLYFKQYLNKDSELYKLAFEPAWPQDFQKDVETNNLPPVSFINMPDPNQEHPPAPPLGGGQAIRQLLSIVMSNPKIWQKTAIFITYDENGGFFDHVNPPTPEPGTKGEYLSSPLPQDAHGIAGPIGLGFRVPMFVISPFSTGGYVSSQVFDHTSMLRFLETRFNVEVPNLSAWRRQTTGDLTNTLDMTSPNFSKINLPIVPYTLSPIDTTSTCSIGTVLGNEPTVPIPNPQSLPVQESGSRKKRPI